ncbi:hypothetical protein ACXHQ0_15730 [Vibrio antiquarius]|uniref:Uncharacterized protein n=2 Tax=Vibrio parahaemolyticus TaxID=670 RepID=A0AA46UPZ7_VIBPH|nr:hypothetical protein [Vibrio parahaemolyticus]UYV29742.1 hypothetical protein M5598_27570 [Vibrio parahaemolyticus]UYW19216.1 hypothetical protein IF561_28725 [Vibrio parahaemolyticus]
MSDQDKLNQMKEAAKRGAMQAAEAAFESGYNSGFFNGYQVGETVGYVRGIDSLKAAVSDGLRHGSPECAKAMQSLKSLGLADDE